MFSQTLKKARRDKGMSQKELAAQLFVSQQAVAKWETGVSTPGPETISNIASVLGISADFLLGREEANIVPISLGKEAIRVKVYPRVPAGVPLEVIDEVIDYEEVPAEWGKGGQKYFATVVKGDSMYPKYLDGDIIIVLQQPTCESGQDAVVYVNGYDATLKKVVFLDDGGIRLQPLNPAYNPRTYYPGDDPIAIAGVVVEIRRKP